MLGIGRAEGVARFEGFELDLRSAELRKPNGTTIRLSEQPLRILVALLERPSELVLREDLRKRLWPNDTIVEFEHSINAAMNRLRQALGDSAESPKFIETLARRGYRWKTSVRWEQPQVAPAPHKPANGNLVGKKVSHYRVLEVVGGGGMGVVYKAEDIKLARRVALKFLPEELAGDPAAMRRFEREARAASALNHLNICTIHAVEEHEAQPFIVMELLEGRTLRDIIADCTNSSSTLPIPTLLDIAIQIAQGLEAAHEKGIIHRDIKPANIFITRHGQVKILDFGLAKLHEFETAEAQSHASTQLAPRPEWNPLLTLTRTGTTVGTAAYMSPEQVRGEKLDARTDLFSFGLVLYEMATGKRAFAGDSAPVLHHAILNERPSPVRDLSPGIPSKIESTINKAIQKERQARYQTAAEIRAELETLKRELGARRSYWWAAAAGTLALFMLIGSFWLARRQPQLPSPPIRFKQLTANSSENRITGAQISPDGQSLLYTDRTGMHLKLIATGKTQTITLPEQLREKNMELSLADFAWSRDGARFLANAHPSGVDVALISEAEVLKRGGLSTWEFSVPAGAFRKLRDMAWADSYSPDGSLISFRTNKGRLGTREIWLMDSNGSQAHKILESGGESGIGVFTWSPDGRRVSYLRDNGTTLVATGHYWEGDHLGKESSRSDLSPDLMDKNEVLDGAELPDGRVIIAVQEHGTNSRSGCNFWTVRIDQKTGNPVEKPQQLTHWPGVCMSHISFTNDGKKLTFIEWAYRSTIDAADLQAGGRRIANERHFTLTESGDYPIDWTPDSKKIIFVSNRSGHYEFYLQPLDEDTAQVLVDAPGSSCCVSPDGRWFIYLTHGKSGDNSAWQLMRAPIAGGPSQEILTLKNLVDSSCARSPSRTCVIAERAEDQKQVVITAFDLLKGRGSELTRISVDPETETGPIKLSPDGSRLAVIRNTANPLQILSLKGELLREIKIPTWDHDTGPITWATDSRSLYVPVAAPEGAFLLHISLAGAVHVLRTNEGGPYTSGIPSPDGRHIAIGTSVQTENVWMMENF